MSKYNIKNLKKRYRLQMFWVYISNHIISRVFISGIRMLWYRRIMHYNIGQNSSILTGFRVSCKGNLLVGNNTVINNECKFDNRFKISIGNSASISYGVNILTKGHNIGCPNFSTAGGQVIIEDYVWICTNATILPGVTLGRGSVVLTSAVVTKSIPPMAVVGGNPAKIIKYRECDLTYKLNWNPWVPFWG